MTLIPFSDFEVRSFKMHLIAKNDDDDDDKGKSNVLIIIIIVLACVITVGFTIYIFILVRNKKKNKDEQRGSLLTDDRTDRQSIEPRTGDYVPPSAPVAAARVSSDES